ncbi:hypothetical protein ACFP56_06370 [Paenibacillus septentrionalis]|uniref:Uncharacterized protein n=1 Tax=Paenibacillus septentrionalis TaxID=429342 RepID=A0ABW1V0I4_9BACL
MKDMKLKPMAVAFAICLVLLIGGGFTYQYVAQEKPLNQSLSQANYSHIELTGNKNEGYKVQLDILDEQPLHEAVAEAKKLLGEHGIGEGSYTVELKQEQTALSEVWEAYLFDIAEIMANQRYSELPELMNRIEEAHAHVDATTSVDEQYIYISLIADGQRLDKLLPLDGGTMGVWNNEK